MNRQWTGSVFQAPDQLQSQMLIKAVRSTQVYIPDSLSSQASSSLATNHRTSSATLVKPQCLPPQLQLQQTHAQHQAAAGFNPRKNNDDEGEEVARGTERWRKTMTVGRKERRKRCASGKLGSKQPASGLARCLPQSCSSPYLALRLLHWSVWLCVRPRQSECTGNECLCVWEYL